jgi:hypothetical protein
MSPHKQGIIDSAIQTDVYDPLTDLSKQESTTNDQTGSSDEMRGLGEQVIINGNQQSKMGKHSAELRRTQRVEDRSYTMDGNSDQVTDPNEQETLNIKETNVIDQIVGLSEQKSSNGYQKSEKGKPGAELRHPQLRDHVIGDTKEENSNGDQSSATENMGSIDVHDTEAVASAPSRRIRKPIIVILHMFPGPRRHGDLQAQIEEMNTGADCIIVTLSMDIDVGADHEIQASQKAAQFWSDRIMSGQVQGAVVGTPCDTWSGAHQPDNGPRPLRTEDQRWGRRNLTKRENDQVSTANHQLMASLSIIMCLTRMGGFAILEHPAIAQWQQQAPNIWGLVFMTIIMQSEDCEQFDSGQSRYLALRVPALRAQILSAPNSGQRQHPNGHRKSQGRAAELCKRMATAIHQAARAAHGGAHECTSTDEAIKALQAESTSTSQAELTKYYVRRSAEAERT